MFHAAVVRVPAGAAIGLKHAAVRRVAQGGRGTGAKVPPHEMPMLHIASRHAGSALDPWRENARTWPRRAHRGDIAPDRGEVRGLSLAGDAGAPAALCKTLHRRQAPEIEPLHIRTIERTMRGEPQ